MCLKTDHITACARFSPYKSNCHVGIPIKYNVVHSYIPIPIFKNNQDKKINKNAHTYFMSDELLSYIDKHAIKDHAHCQADSADFVEQDAEDVTDGSDGSNSQYSHRKLTIEMTEIHANPLSAHHNHTKSSSTATTTTTTTTSSSNSNDVLVKVESVAHMGMAQADI